MIMKAVICRKPGAIADLALGELPDPLIAPGHLLIDVAAAGVNFPDGLIVEGKHMARPEPPFAPGGEAAGIVVAVAPDVAGFAIGDRVVALATSGAFAERMLAPAVTSYAVPADVPLDVAAASLITYATTYHALKDRGRLSPGETVLVLGAAGGTGLAAVELAKYMGARVIAAASTTEKLALAKSRGADELINYSEESLKDALRARIGLHNVDIVYDPVGGPLAEDAARLLGWGGRYLVIGFANGEIPRLPINLFLIKGADLLGVLWGLAARADPELHHANVAELLAAIGRGALHPAITERYPLDRAIEALGTVMRRRVLGKVIVTVKDG